MSRKSAVADRSSSSADSVDNALQHLAAVAREQLAAHPQRHLLQPADQQIEVTVELPIGRGADLSAAQDRLLAAVRTEIDSLIAQRNAFRPGHVLNLRTDSSEGADTGPPDSRFVFGGYSPTGVPRFLDFGQWLLQIEHPRLDAIYQRPPALVTAITSGDELYRELLAAFEEPANGYRLHGQVTVGWYRIPRPDGTNGTLALTFLIVSSGHGKKRRFAINLLGSDVDGEPLDALYERLEETPWKGALSWGQSAIETVGKGSDEEVAKRVEGILGGIARRLEQTNRSRARRTSHADSRHRSGDRPTRQAVSDLQRADDEAILFDRRRDTLIVLGDRGRAHVWSRAGKLVTSIRYSPESIQRKRQHRIWRDADREQVEALRQAVVALDRG